MVEHAHWRPPHSSYLAEELRSGPQLIATVLELIRTAVLSGRWGYPDVEPLLPALNDMAAAGPRSSTYCHWLMRLLPLDLAVFCTWPATCQITFCRSAQ